MPTSRSRTGGAFLRLGLVLAFAFVAACSDSGSPTGPASGPDLARGGTQGPDLRAAIAAQAKYEKQLMAQAGVEGIGIGLASQGKAAVVIMTANGAVGGLPATLDGVAVKLMPTGPFSAIPPRTYRPQPGNGNGHNGGGGGGGGGGSVDPTSVFPRPVPIGVSIGNIDDPVYCSAGTFGARVTKGGNVYILSNNHVLARQNAGSIGERIQQPGDYDNNCQRDDNLVIGHLAAFVTINFAGGNNTVDAAIASSSTSDIGNATYTGGYGTPSSTTRPASLGMAVTKCGRTTKCTHGSVAVINAEVNVQYDGGVAHFVNQVVVSGNRGPFSKAGDSGSLIVTDDPSNNPVALLFAGSQTATIGNPIDAVLSALNISIDGK